MNDTWRQEVAEKLGSQPLGTVLNTGLSSTELFGLLPNDLAQQIIIVEPDPVKARTLQRRYDDNSAVTIVPAAITREIGHAILHCFNLSWAAALRQPSGLKTLFPGLIETGQIKVQTQTVETVLNNVNLDGEGDHVLILGSAGEEMDTIETMITMEVLQRFNHIIVPLPSVKLYENSTDGPTIRDRLKSVGFKIESQDNSDPDIPIYYMRLDKDSLDLMTELKKIKQENETLINKLANIEQDALLERDQKARIQILGDTYRHAIRLELQKPAATFGHQRPKVSVALAYLKVLDDLPAADKTAVIASPTFRFDGFTKASNHAAKHAENHIVLDVKSVPRSGLHYMKTQFSKILQDHFSFCEWYQEPGCCKRMPCVHFPHATDRGDGGSLRMLKSHDFDLADPIYPVTPGTQRLIMTRDPIFILTSHWLLHLLEKNKDILKSNDINIEKIYYLHNSEILSRAYQLLDGAKYIPDEENVSIWLEQQRKYLLGFSKKWSVAARMPRTYVVPYEKTALAVQSCLTPIRKALSVEQRERLDAYAANWQVGFKPRSDAFEGPTPQLTSLLQKHAILFKKTADIICKIDTGNLFRNAQELNKSDFS